MAASSISVFAPATVANLACGFDILGMAVHKPGDGLIMKLNNTGKINIDSITGDGGKLSYHPMKNTAGVAVASMLKKLRSKQGVTITLNKQMPLGSGLGSSAASSAAAAFAFNELIKRPFTRHELVTFAMEGERIACGSAHADNVAPALLGGIVLVRSIDPLDLISLPVPAKLFIVVVHPHQVLMTKKSRAVLKKNIPIKTVVAQMGNTAAFIASLYKNDYSLMARSAVDYLAEPYRSPLISGFNKVKKSALEKGALVCSISGSGPAVFALCDSRDNALQCGKAMSAAFEKNNIMSDLFISRVNTKGVVITG
jgi:homoserine kinase